MPVFEKHDKNEKVEKHEKADVKKTDAHCTVEGCFELKAPGQTHVCVKHIRTN